jgi:hypothetical protein
MNGIPRRPVRLALMIAALASVVGSMAAFVPEVDVPAWMVILAAACYGLFLGWLVVGLLLHSPGAATLMRVTVLGAVVTVVTAGGIWLTLLSGRPEWLRVVTRAGLLLFGIWLATAGGLSAFGWWRIKRGGDNRSTRVRR